MSTVGDVMTVVDTLGEVGGFVMKLVARYIDGDDSEPVRRAVDILPEKLRSRVELDRQRTLAAREARDDWAAGHGRATVAGSLDGLPTRLPIDVSYEDIVLAAGKAGTPSITLRAGEQSSALMPGRRYRLEAGFVLNVMHTGDA